MKNLEVDGKNAEDLAPLCDPRSQFNDAAVRVGLIRPGDMLDESMVEFAMEIVTLAARIGDRFDHPTCA